MCIQGCIMALFYVNLGSYLTIAIVEGEYSDRAILEMRLEDHLRRRLEVGCLDSCSEVHIEYRRCANQGFTKVTPGFTGDWKIEALIERLDAIIDTFSLASRVQRDQWGRVVVEALVERIDETEALLCEYPEGSGNRVFLTAEDRTRIIREGNASADYWIIPEHNGGAVQITRRVLRDVALMWVKAAERPVAPVVETCINWDDDDILF
jgi:hypothetical protein